MKSTVIPRSSSESTDDIRENRVTTFIVDGAIADKGSPRIGVLIIVGVTSTPAYSYEEDHVSADT